MQGKKVRIDVDTEEVQVPKLGERANDTEKSGGRDYV